MILTRTETDMNAGREIPQLKWAPKAMTCFRLTDSHNFYWIIVAAKKIAHRGKEEKT